MAKEKNKKVVRVVKEMKNTGVKVLREYEWQVKGDLVLKKEKVYMSKNKKLRIEIIKLHYNILVVGYKER